MDEGWGWMMSWGAGSGLGHTGTTSSGCWGTPQHHPDLPQNPIDASSRMGFSLSLLCSTQHHPKAILNSALRSEGILPTWDPMESSSCHRGNDPQALALPPVPKHSALRNHSF